MMVRPKNNLPPESQPWARSIETDIDELTRVSVKNAENNTNAFRGLNSTLTAIGDQIIQLSTPPTRVSGEFSEVGSLVSAPAETPVWSQAITAPTWATQATVFMSLTVRAIGDPAAFDAMFVANVGADVGAASANSAVYADGTYARTGSSTLIYYYNTNELNLADGVINVWISRSRSALPAGKTWSAKLQGIVLWNRGEEPLMIL